MKGEDVETLEKKGPVKNFHYEPPAYEPHSEEEHKELNDVVARMEKLTKEQGTVKTDSPGNSEFQLLEESVNTTLSIQPKNELEAVNL